MSEGKPGGVLTPEMIGEMAAREAVRGGRAPVRFVSPSEYREMVERAAIESAANHGAPDDMFHVDYGQILKGGEITEEGIKFFKENYEHTTDSTGTTFLVTPTKTDSTVILTQRQLDDYNKIVNPPKGKQVTMNRAERRAAGKKLKKVKKAVAKKLQSPEIELARTKISRLLAEFFKDSPEKVHLWLRLNNPALGGVSPEKMIVWGRHERLLSFVRNQLEESGYDVNSIENGEEPKFHPPEPIQKESEDPR